MTLTVEEFNPDRSYGWYRRDYGYRIIVDERYSFTKGHRILHRCGVPRDDWEYFSPTSYPGKEHGVFYFKHEEHLLLFKMYW